ncbi:MAG: inner membrane protein YccA [Osedax symbiont Rs1]|nr:MAG: inner membrane protein YccA [Osedax symbiont Rs1]
MNNINVAAARSEQSILQTNKVIRNTYMLLSMTLLFSAVTAVISLSLEITSMWAYLGSIIAGMVVLFIIGKKQNSVAALPLTFLFTGLWGFALGPILNHYLAMSNGGDIVVTALGMTALTFVGLSAYVFNSKKDFSFMGGFLAAGSMVLIIAMVAMFILPVFGIDVSAMHLAFSAAVVLLMAGFILYDTSKIVDGTYQNYVMATVGLYVNIFNMFIHMLALVGFLNDD